MNKHQLRNEGALGLDPCEWKRYAVDGDRDGHIHRGDIADSAATLARLIWSHGGLEAGVFAHNQAEWYVEQVMQGAEEIEGACKVTYIDWRVAPLGTGTEVAGATGGPRPRRPRQRPALGARRRSRPRSPPPTRSPPPPTSGAAATAPGTPTATTARARSASPSTAPACSNTPLTSGALESYGEPGPGKWITIYANATHTYMVVAGLRWDTVGDESGTGPRWHAEPPYPEGFVVRHPVGY